MLAQQIADIREPVTEMDVERNAVLEAQLKRKLEVQKESLTAQDKEIWQREMQVSHLQYPAGVNILHFIPPPPAGGIPA